MLILRIVVRELVSILWIVDRELMSILCSVGMGTCVNTVDCG